MNLDAPRTTHQEVARPGSTQGNSGACQAGLGGGRAQPPKLAKLLTQCGQLILKKISNSDATRCHILRLKCTKFDFRWGSVQTLLGVLIALPQTQ